MQKNLLTVLVTAALLPGCAWMSPPPIPQTPIKNPRIVERDLTPDVKKTANRVKSRDLPGAQSLDDGEQFVQVTAVTPPQLEAKPGQVANPAPVTPTAVAVPHEWKVLVGDVRLATTFERWANEAAVGAKPEHFKVLWDAGKHVLIDATPTYKGTFLDAVNEALSSPAIKLSAYPLEACVYQNSPPLVRITKRGDQTEACPDFKQ